MSENVNPIQQEDVEILTEEAVIEKKHYNNREEILARMSEIASIATEEVRNEMTFLKLTYYKIRQSEVDAELQQFLQGDADPSSYVAKSDDLEPRLKELLNVQKEARTAMVEARNKMMAENLAKKQDILRQMIAIAQDADGVGQQYNNFMDLQKQFKEVGPIDSAEINPLWKQFNMLVEQFYDALKINKELRDYDFKKNLERKSEIIAEAEKLAQSDDLLPAFRRLQELHEEWKGLGPVAPELREEIWAKFKAASTLLNKRHQDHFEAIKAEEAANEAAKSALCDRIESINNASIESAKDWDEQTKAVLTIQEEWRKLGAVSRKANSQLFERFRQLCDVFFQNKAQFFKSIKEEQNANLALKIGICEKAEALKDSTEWRKTTDILVNLQKEWKTIGPVSRKMSNAVWERFRSACDAFFEAKEKAVGDERAIEAENLAKKQAIVEKLRGLADKYQEVEPQQIRDIMAEWNEAGHVPFREKDKLYAAYKQQVDFFFDHIDMKGKQARMQNFKQRVANQSKNDGQNEHQKLTRTLERLQNDLKTYENNLGFLSSKKGNGMVALMERQMENLKAEIKEVKEKLALLGE